MDVNKAGWPNGKALDYESRDCRFDPCVGHFFFLLLPVLHRVAVFNKLTLCVDCSLGYSRLRYDLSSDCGVRET